MKNVYCKIGVQIMKKRQRAIIVAGVTAVAAIVCFICIYIGKGKVNQNNENPLAPYEAELERLNEELGKKYQLSPTGDDTYEEMVAFFTSMTIEEFEAYIREAYRKEAEFDERMPEGVAVPEKEGDGEP